MGSDQDRPGEDRGNPTFCVEMESDEFSLEFDVTGADEAEAVSNLEGILSWVQDCRDDKGPYSSLSLPPDSRLRGIRVRFSRDWVIGEGVSVRRVER